MTRSTSNPSVSGFSAFFIRVHSKNLFKVSALTCIVGAMEKLRGVHERGINFTHQFGWNQFCPGLSQREQIWLATIPA